MMLTKRTQTVMDLAPWPTGMGFDNASFWWDYVRSQEESQKLDLLLMMALLSDDVCQLLLNNDRTLLDLFQFSEPTVVLLLDARASSLAAFAEYLLTAEICEMRCAEGELDEQAIVPSRIVDAVG